ncbi:mitochondrial disaggregase-like [Styela clava]
MMNARINNITKKLLLVPRRTLLINKCSSYKMFSIHCLKPCSRKSIVDQTFRLIYTNPNENPKFSSASRLSPLLFLAIGFIANDEGNDSLLKRKLKASILHYSVSGDIFGLRHTLGELKKCSAEVADEIINSTHKYGWTPLMAAAVNGHIEILLALLDAGANPNHTDLFTTSRHISHKFHIDELGVRRERENNFSDELNHYSNFLGFTALHYAAVADSNSCVTALLNRGADALIKNHLGHKASSYVSEENDELYDLLISHEKAQSVKKEAEEAQERLKFPLEKRLKEHIVGQVGPISTVSSCIRRKQNGWYDEDHPLVFLFLGSSGVGKTELAKQVANYLHKGDKKSFIRLDMSEYQEKHEVAKLIGAPPGYIGHNEGGQLTKKLKAKPDAVVLFDEVDKAHPDVLTVLLQLFDEGRLTDGRGRTIDCKNAIFVMTSNLASDEIAQYGAKLRREADNVRKSKLDETENQNSIPSQYSSVSRSFKENVVQPILKRHFGRDEFLGRINEFVYFLPFSDNELIELVERELEMWRAIAAKKHKVKITWQTPSIPTILADGYNIYYGARSIKYEVDRRVVSLLASAHERGILKEGCNVLVSTPTKNAELAQSNNLSSAPIQLEIRTVGDKSVIVSEKDVWGWHHNNTSMV